MRCGPRSRALPIFKAGMLELVALAPLKPYPGFGPNGLAEQAAFSSCLGAGVAGRTLKLRYSTQERTSNGLSHEFPLHTRT